MIHRSILCLNLFLNLMNKFNHLSVAYLFFLLAIQIWCVMSTIYPACIACEITAPSGATQIRYPGYWELYDTTYMCGVFSCIYHAHSLCYTCVTHVYQHLVYMYKIYTCITHVIIIMWYTANHIPTLHCERCVSIHMFNNQMHQAWILKVCVAHVRDGPFNIVRVGQVCISNMEHVISP